jgi:hypothetical protein
MRARSLLLLGQCTSSRPRPRRRVCSPTSTLSVHNPWSTPGSGQDLAAAQLEMVSSTQAESPPSCLQSPCTTSRSPLYSSACPSHASWPNDYGQRYMCLPGHNPLHSSARFHDWFRRYEWLRTSTGPQQSLQCDPGRARKLVGFQALVCRRNIRPIRQTTCQDDQRTPGFLGWKSRHRWSTRCSQQPGSLQQGND